MDTDQAGQQRADSPLRGEALLGLRGLNGDTETGAQFQPFGSMQTCFRFPLFCPFQKRASILNF